MSRAQIAAPCQIACNQGDLTTKIQLLGNVPVTEGMTGRARNIWDLQKYQNRIYLGYGNTTTNPGPIKLYSIDADKTYHFEREIRAEAIEKFRIINGRLIVPNSDPLGGQNDMLKITDKSTTGQWTEHLWSPSLAHTRDIIEYQDSLYMFGNSWGPGQKTNDYGSLHITNDSYGQLNTGSLINELMTADPLDNSEWNWFFGGFVYKDTLVLPNAVMTKEYRPDRTLAHTMSFMRVGNNTKWSYNQPAGERMTHEDFYPVNTSLTTPSYPQSYIIAYPFASAEFDDKLLISYRSYSLQDALYQDAYNNSAGMVIKDHLRDDASFVNFPEVNAEGEDMFIYGDAIYVLAHLKNSPFSITNIIYKSKNPGKNSSDWTEVLRFDSRNIARSFEYMDGYFYFGLGANFGDQIANCGQMLRIPVDCDNSSCTLIGQPCDDLDICTTNDSYDNNCNCYGLYQDTDADGICDAADCNPTLNISGITHAMNPSFHTSNWIMSDALIQAPIDIEYSAVNEITMDVGFEVVPQKNFHAYIGPCN